MKIVGIIAEYNPFHKGHAYQIRKIRELLGEDTAIVCVMSGDFVQRGEPAIFSKYARAEAAINCGADLVIELPVHYALGSAERFAEGAVNILGRLGVVDYLVFGSESGNCAALEETAKTLLSPEYDERLRIHLRSGCSFPAARSAALRDLMEGCDMTITPNDNLGAEYIKAIYRGQYHIKPLAIARVGAMHDTVYDGEMKSGSELRALLHDKKSVAEYVPAEVNPIYIREMEQGRGPVSIKSLESLLLSRLRMMKLDVFQNLADASEGLENRLYHACRTKTSLSDIYDSVKSKRYTHARIRRMTMCAALGITKSDYEENNLYARVLALNGRGGKLLRQSEPVRTIDVISKPSAAREMERSCLSMFSKTSDSHDLYVLGYVNQEYGEGELDWITSPVFVHDR